MPPAVPLRRAATSARCGPCSIWSSRRLALRPIRRRRSTASRFAPRGRTTLAWMPRARRGWIIPRRRWRSRRAGHVLRGVRGDRLPARPGPRPRPRPLATFARRSPLRDLDAVRVLGAPLVDVGLQVTDRRADREVRGTFVRTLAADRTRRLAATRTARGRVR